MAMRKRQGFTLVEIMIVVAIIGLLAAIAIPNFVKNRAMSQKNACINNLRLIDGAKEQWAMESGQDAGATAVTTEINTYLKGSTTPACPTKGGYAYNDVGTKPACSITAHNGY
jgi:prepilin-type N-terminal cleavage/methylation domain-containing protein